MSRVVRLLVALVMMVGILQWVVPQWAAAQISRRVAALDQGKRPQVTLAAIPFWELASGRFQDLFMKSQAIRLGPIEVASAQLNWQNGQVAVASLMKGRLAIVKSGRVSMSIRLNGQALADFLAKQGKIQNTRVTVTTRDVRIQGRMTLAGVDVPVDTTGTILISADRSRLIFHPTVIDGINLPMMTDVQILDLSTLNLPLPLAIRSVVLAPDSIVVNAGTP
ncbi:MAG: LmeA family phospholipid-binding protein [Thermaerobacter sp.]|nr:LmeA family phospholipid-binding protein [Thermaerobacter sp.]